MRPSNADAPKSCCLNPPLSSTLVAETLTRQFQFAQTHDTNQQFLRHQTRRSYVAAIQHDENSECGFFGTNEERDSGREAMAASAKKRQHPSPSSQNGGVLFRGRRCWTH